MGPGKLLHVTLKLFRLLDVCVSSLRRGHANFLCIVPILTDDPRRESKSRQAFGALKQAGAPAERVSQLRPRTSRTSPLATASLQVANNGHDNDDTTTTTTTTTNNNSGK